MDRAGLLNLPASHLGSDHSLGKPLLRADCMPEIAGDTIHSVGRVTGEVRQTTDEHRGQQGRHPR